MVKDVFFCLHQRRGSLIFTGEFQGEISLNGSAQISFVTVIQPPRPIAPLLVEEILDHARLLPRIRNPQKEMKHDVFTGDRDIGFEFSPPVPILVLSLEEKIGGIAERLFQAAEPGTLNG